MARSALPRARRRIAGAAATLALAAGVVALAPPAQAYTTRVETVNQNAGLGVDEVITIPGVVNVNIGTTLRFARTVGYDEFTSLFLDGPTEAPYDAMPTRVPNTTTAWEAPLIGLETGPIKAYLYAASCSGENRAVYVFTLQRSDRYEQGIVRLPISSGSVVREIRSGAWTSKVLSGTRVTYVAPPGVSFRNATVRAGRPLNIGDPQIDYPTEDDLAVTRVSSGTSLQFTVPANASPGWPIEQPGYYVNLEITVPSAPTQHGTGKLVLLGKIIVDPAGTAWSAPPAPVAQRTDTLLGGEGLPARRTLWSRNGTYRLTQQANTNLVLWKGSTALWQTGQKGAAWAELNGDGNLIQRNASGAVVWQTASYGARNQARLVVQNDGNLVIYGENGKALWASRTTGR